MHSYYYLSISSEHLTFADIIIYIATVIYHPAEAVLLQESIMNDIYKS